MSNNKKVLVLLNPSHLREQNTKELLLSKFKYSNIYDAKRKLNLAKADDVYKLLLNQYNENELKKYNDAIQVKQNKQKVKRDKAIRNMIKRNQEIQQNILKNKFKRNLNNEILNSKILNKKKEYKVVIIVKLNVYWKKTKKSYIINTDYTETFNTSNLDEEIKLFLDGYFPFEDEYKIVTLIEYKYKEVENFKFVRKIDVPMKRAIPLKISFLEYFDSISENAYKDYDDMCVIKALQEHLNIKKEKTITDVFREASLKLYNKEWNEKDGVTARMIKYFCQIKHIACLGLDQKNKCIVKYTNDKIYGKYRPIIFYQVAGHFYIMDKNLNSISQSFKENKVIVSSVLIDDEENKKTEYNYINYEDIIKYDFNDDENIVEEEGEDGYFKNGEKIECNRDYKHEFETFKALPKNTIVLFKQGNLNNELIEYVKLYNDCPKVKYESKSNCKSIYLKNQIILTVTDCIIDNKYVMEICKNEEIDYNNQTIGTLIQSLFNKFYDLQSGRIRINNEQKTSIITNQNNLCPLCKNPLKSYQIDHIRPLANGGTNEFQNLQALCPSCHKEKSIEEKLNCDYHKVKDYISNYSIEAYNTINSKLFNKVQFTQYLLNQDKIDEFKNEGYYMKSIDDNKCRRNLLINYNYDFPVYSCLDNIRKFDGNITCGFYYIESNNVFPLRKNGFYSQPIVEYCIKNKIISKFDILYQYKPSFTLKPDYFKPAVEYLLKVFEDNKDLQKLSINALIGMFGRRENSFIDNEVVDLNNKEDLASVYSTYRSPFINTLNDDFAIITEKINIDKLENSYPIYAQILDCEALELHKKVQLLRQNNFIPICIKTDAVVYFSKSEKGFNTSNYYWDKEKTILKYKDEEPQLLKKSIDYVITDKFKLQPKKYNVIEDDKTFNFNIEIAKKIIESNKGCFLDGAAGTGKSRLINEMNKLLEGKKVFKLTPTNVSALIINGETIDKFANRILINNKSIHKLQDVDYIFIDEISMVKEKFYSVFLSVKYYFPNIKFIVSGDFYQLDPVNDRKYFNYEFSRALYELVDGNKLNLSLCRRSDDRLFNICENIKLNNSYDVTCFQNNDWLSYVNLCYTNAKRKEINQKCMDRFIKEQQPNLIYNVNALAYDDNTQDYKLCVGMPLISRLNRKDLDILNNEMFKCKKINNNSIVISNQFKELEIEKSIFDKLFNLAFCVTIHKSQGMSINERYVIYEWNKMYNKLKYVALSRATEFNNINII